VKAGAGTHCQVGRPRGVAGLGRGDAGVEAGIVGVQIVDEQRAVDGHRDTAARTYEHALLMPVNPRRGCTDRSARQRGDALQRQGLIRRAQLDYGRRCLLDGRHLYYDRRKLYLMVYFAEKERRGRLASFRLYVPVQE